MKKLLLFSSLLLIAHFSRAQISQGTILLGGNLGFSTSSQKLTVTGTPTTNSSATSINVYPSIGIAVQDDLVLGLNLGVGYSDASNFKQNDYSAGIFLRKYKSLGNRFYFFGQTVLGFAYFENNTPDTPNTVNYQHTKGYTTYLGFSPGIAYSLSHRWQLEVEFPNVLEAQYNHNRTDFTYQSSVNPPTETEQHEVNNSFGFNTSLTTNFQLEVGLRFFIGS